MQHPTPLTLRSFAENNAPATRYARHPLLVLPTAAQPSQRRPAPSFPPPPSGMASFRSLLIHAKSSAGLLYFSTFLQSVLENSAISAHGTHVYTPRRGMGTTSMTPAARRHHEGTVVPLEYPGYSNNENRDHTNSETRRGTCVYTLFQCCTM